MWLIATFLIPIFQSVLANELYKEGKFHWNVLLKSKVFWILLALWIIGNIVAKIMESNNSNDNQAVKKKNKLSINGDGNTVNQDVTTINNYADPVVGINSIDDKKKLEAVMDGIASVVGQKHDLGPYYSTGVKLENGKAVFYSKEEIPEAREKYPMHYQGKFQIDTKGYAFNEFLQRAVISQKPIEIKCCDLVKMLGDIPDPYQDIVTKNADKSKFFIVPEPLPQPIQCSMKVKGKVAIYDDIWLQIIPVNPDDNIIVISNKNKKGDIVVTLTHHKDTGATNFTYSFVADTWYQVKNNIQFLKDARAGETIQIRNKKTSDLIFICQLPDSLAQETIEELDDNMAFVNKIITIIENYNCNIDVDIAITKMVENAIDIIYAGIVGKSIDSEWKEEAITADFSDADIQHLKNKMIIVVRQEAFFEFSGWRFDKIIFDNEIESRLKNYDEVKKLIDEGAEQQTAIFIPDGNNVLKKNIDLSSMEITKVEEKETD